MLAAPASEFPAALACLERAAEHAAALPRLSLPEDEYNRPTLSGEFDWLRTLLTHLDTGTLQ
ncbi:MAG: hypothetical protein ACRDTA_22885 [Pseudonocardiaceae bacterium]